MPNHQAREAISRDRVPFYVQLAEAEKYGWVPNFLKREQRLAELNQAKRELAELKKADPDFSEFAEVVRGSYARDRASKVEAIAKRLYALLQSPDPMAGFRRAQSPQRFEIIEFSLVEEALAFIEANYTGGITSADKAKQIGAIEKRISKIEAEAAELLPPALYETNDPGTNARICKVEVFIDHWRNLAVWTIGAVNPRGRVLRGSSEEEQKAFYALGLDRLTSRAARLEPFPD